MKTQWECFLQNLGEWRGSFTTYSPQGEWREDIPSLLSLTAIPERSAVKLVLQRDAPRFPQPLELEFSSLSRSLLFFETGAFSQGAMQFAPYSQFGAEFGLVTPDRRLRTVMLYNTQSELDYVTLIREQRVGSDVAARPPLQVDDLVGEWQGEAMTLFPDWRSPEMFTSYLAIERVGDLLRQRLQFGDRTIETTAVIMGNLLKYDNSPLPVQIMLLPDGASVNCPLKVELGHPFVLETGWLRTPTQRERIIRSFSAKGEWVGLTLVTEQKVG
jgi:hypothetical protein